MAQRATSLGPKPSLFFLVFVFFVFCCFVFFGGFKGQVRWPKGPPHLALNPPYFFLFFFCFCFFLCFPLFVFSIDKKTCFPPKKRSFFVYFQCLPLFLFSLFWASPLCSLSLSLSLSCLFLSSFLPVFHFLFLVFLFFLFVVFAFFVSRCSFVFVFLLVVFNHNI